MSVCFLHLSGKSFQHINVRPNCFPLLTAYIFIFFHYWKLHHQTKSQAITLYVHFGFLLTRPLLPLLLLSDNPVFGVLIKILQKQWERIFFHYSLNFHWKWQKRKFTDKTKLQVVKLIELMLNMIRCLLNTRSPWDVSPWKFTEKVQNKEISSSA